MRFELIDTARGICLFWMVFSHVLTTSGVDENSWFNYLRPPGWSTTNFVMLTGLALAFLAYKGASAGVVVSKAKWRRRGFQLLAVAYVSNSIFTFLRLVASGHFPDLATSASVLFLQEPWTISAILLPPAILLFIAGWLKNLVDKLGAIYFFGFVSLSELMFWTGMSSVPEAWQTSLWYQSLFVFENAWFGFPLVYLLGLGVWGFAVGCVFRVAKTTGWLKVAVLVLLPLYYLHAVPTPVIFLFRFGVTLFAADVIGALAAFFPAKAVLDLFGRSSLLIFIMHRVFLQIGKMGFADLIPTQRAWLLLLVTVVLCALLCIAKETHPPLARRLKAVGF